MWLADLFTTINPFTYRKEHNHIMTALENLNENITKLNDAITAETEQQKASMRKLQDEIDALKAGGTDTAGIQEAADAIGASVARVQAIVPDAPSETPAG